ncbi:MAG: hypothetical protein QMD71_09885 [bacterium]|nr:hypothetical protein [bacterium]
MTPLLLSLLPGGGQFYNNEPIKGIPILALSSYLGHIYYTKRGNLPLAGIAIFYLGSAFEAFYKK